MQAVDSRARLRVTASIDLRIAWHNLRSYDLARRRRVRAAFFAARERVVLDGRPTGPGGTRLPSRRASESPIAIACLRLLTLPPRPPLPRFKVPRLNFRISRSTSFEALRAYLLAIDESPFRTVSRRA